MRDDGFCMSKNVAISSENNVIKIIKIDNFELSLMIDSLIVSDENFAFFECDRDSLAISANENFFKLNNFFGGSPEKICIPRFYEKISIAIARGKKSITIDRFDSYHSDNLFIVKILPIFEGENGVIKLIGVYQKCPESLKNVVPSLLPQERFKDFSRASSDWYWEIDAQYNFVFLSDRVTAIIGKPVSFYLGKPLSCLGRLEQNLYDQSPIEQAWQKKTPFRDQLFILNSGADNVSFSHLSGVPIFDVAGKFIGYRGTGTDVTRIYFLDQKTRATYRHLEKTLEELHSKNIALDVASGQAHAALDAKNEFLAAMSHELRTPLNAIIGFAEAMKMQVFGNLKPHYVAYANDILTAGHHLLGLIDDILDVSVIDNGGLTLNIETVSVDFLVDQARSLLVLRAESKGLDISKVKLKSGVCVKADERRALQIFVNLITNAVKFTPQGGRIGVTIRVSEANMAEITVWDTGPGIAPENQERIFEKFQQCVDDTYVGKPEGTGLGLHISRQLAQLMGGRIELFSEPGHGAYFTVYLPVA